MDKDLKQKIKNLAQKIGYSACGITTIKPFKEDEQGLRKRMKDFPEAAHLYEYMLGRYYPAENVPWAKSIVVCIRQYGKYKIPPGLDSYIGKNYLCDRRHKECPDYEMPIKMKQGLRDLGIKVKSITLSDRWAAARAGVARFGRNNFVSTEKEGSWINIEKWVVDAELEPDTPTLEPACPEACRACIDACPTQALTEPFSMRMDRCIAHLT